MVLFRLDWVVGMVLSLMTSAAWAQDVPTTKPAAIKIALAGDSTVTDNAGWGGGFAQALGPGVAVVNISKGGRASGSFIKEGRWQQILDLKPDYVLVQFGHNDQPGHGPDRETDPQTTYKQNITRYVEEAIAAGIKPVLVTPLSRREWKDDGKIHSGLQPYADAVKQIAAEKHVPLIDLHAKSIEIYEQIGKDKMAELSPTKNADPKSKNSDTTAVPGKVTYDGTHLNEKGGVLFGKLMADELVKAVPALAGVVKQP